MSVYWYGVLIAFSAAKTECLALDFGFQPFQAPIFTVLLIGRVLILDFPGDFILSLAANMEQSG